MKGNEIVAFIFARGGSKRLPKKNLKLLAGKPLIAHSILSAQKCPEIDRIIVSTDSQEIAETALAFGAEVPFMRPQHLAEDASDELHAWKHAILEYRKKFASTLELFVSLPTTSPLRNPEDISSCIDLFKKSVADIVVTTKDASRNPYFNMLRLSEDGYAEIFAKDGSKILSFRQELPKVYDMTTVAYVASPEYILETKNLLEGKVKVVNIEEERALDIDTALDFKIAEYLMSQKTCNK